MLEVIIGQEWSLLLSPHCPDLSDLVTSNCKEEWKMSSRYSQRRRGIASFLSQWILISCIFYKESKRYWSLSIKNKTSIEAAPILHSAWHYIDQINICWMNEWFNYDWIIEYEWFNSLLLPLKSCRIVCHFHVWSIFLFLKKWYLIFVLDNVQECFIKCKF